MGEKKREREERERRRGCLRGTSFVVLRASTSHSLYNLSRKWRNLLYSSSAVRTYKSALSLSLPERRRSRAKTASTQIHVLETRVPAACLLWEAEKRTPRRKRQLKGSLTAARQRYSTRS